MISVLFKLVIGQTFKVDLNNPSLIDNNHTNIRAIGVDSSNNFLVSLDNSQGRKYNPFMTSYVNFSMPEPADFIYGGVNSVKNGSNLMGLGNIIFTLSNNRTTLRNYDNINLNLIESYVVNDTIRAFSLFFFNTSGRAHSFIAIYCNGGIKIGFNSIVTDLPASYYSSLQILDAR